MSSEILSFSDLAISAPIMKAITDVGYEQPSPIQAASIPHLLNGEDLLGVAQTGTGKTAAFALPLLSKIDISKKNPQILVLAPTRELAIQVAEAFQRYACNLKGFHVLPIYGGQDMSTQLRQLRRGAHVVVGTPGRVMDHLRRSSLDLSGITNIVLDEADEMLRMGFIDDVEWILEHAPKERQTALFSATMPKQIRSVATRYLNNPKEVSIKSDTTTGDNIEQCYWMVSGTNKLDALTRILEVEPFDGMIIFVRTKTATAELAEKLEARGYSASPLNGDMNQQLRERTIDRLKNKQLDIVIATDVAARGIDVQRVSHVLNYDIPYDSEAYVHRIGRTGRAGRSGKAILFVAPREKRLLYAIERATRRPLTAMELPTGETVSAMRIDQFKEKLLETIKSQDLSFFNEVLAQFSHENDIAPEDIASALGYLAQKERPLQVQWANVKPARENRGDRERDNSRNESRERRPRRERGDDSNMTTFRIEVGRSHNARPGDIVGAIANEAGIDSNNIGHIKLHDDFSTVDLPNDMSDATFQTLKKVRVRSQVLNISKDQGGHSSSNSRSDKPRSDRPRSDKPRSDRPRSDKPRGEKKPRRSTPRTD